MKKILLIATTVSVFLTSCENFGKKVEINDKNEVYYKGEGVTETDARNLGTYFEKMGIFDGKEEKAVQVTKEPDAYVVRLVIKEDVVKQDQKRYETIFWYWQDMISENVFNKAKTRVILTDASFKDLIKLDEMNKAKAGEGHLVYYKGQGIDKKEAEEIATKFEKEQIFPYTGDMVILTKENNRYFVRFFTSPQANPGNMEAYYASLANLQYLIGKYVLGNKEVKLILMDDQFKDTKEFNELSTEEKTALDMQMTATGAEYVVD